MFPRRRGTTGNLELLINRSGVWPAFEPRSASSWPDPTTSRNAASVRSDKDLARHGVLHRYLSDPTIAIQNGWIVKGAGEGAAWLLLFPALS